MNLKKIVFALFYFWTTVPLAVALGSDAAGTTTAGFLKIGAGARAAALGEAYCALADEASALYWNAAALTQIKGRSATFMHALYLESIIFDYGAFAQSLGETGAFGIGIQRLSYDTIDQTDDTGLVTGSFSPSDTVLSLGYGHSLGEFSAGFAVKLVQSKIVNSARAQALDFGVLTPTYFNEKMKLAFTVSNFGNKIEFNQESEDLPLALRLGSSLKISEGCFAALDIGVPNDNAPYFALGVEYQWLLADTWNLAGRAGFNSRNRGDVKGLSGISMGFGMSYQSRSQIRQKLSFDYAFVPFGDLGSTHRLSLSLNF